MMATFAMLERVQGANRSLDLTRTANEAFTRLAAQIRSAQCDYDGSAFPGAIAEDTTDPGLFDAAGAGWIGVDTPVSPGSSITYAGLTDGSDPALARTVPPLRIEYRVEEEAAPRAAPDAVRAPPATVGPAYDVDIRVRMLTGDPAMDDPAVENGWWIKHYPIKKVCNARYEGSGRGQFL
jgi:hypothetical protein